MVFARSLTWVTSTALVCTLLLAGCGHKAQQSDAALAAKEAEAAKAYARAQFMWRGRRLIALKRPDGWLSLVGLHWLDPGTHRVGSDRDNGIQMAMGPAHLGVFQVRDGKVSFVADTRVTVDGQPSGGGLLRSDAAPEGPSVIGFDEGKGQATVIVRGGRLALRVKHADADSLQRFTGLEYWPGGRGWQLPARFVPHAAGKTLPVVNIIGTTDNLPNPGVVEFSRGGTTYRLEALDEGEDTLKLVFADLTSGHGSYPAGRFLDVPRPDAKGMLMLDFNHAYNPPCAFTPFATCPLPPPENRLALSVDAGEKMYRSPETPTKDVQ